MASILVVACDRDVRDLVATYLDDQHHLVVTATDAESAWVRLLGVVPDLLLVDRAVPGMTGLGLVRRCRSHPALRELPILMLSVHSRPSDAAEARTVGVTDYLAMPFHLRDLSAAVARCTSTVVA